MSARGDINSTKFWREEARIYANQELAVRMAKERARKRRIALMDIAEGRVRVMSIDELRERLLARKAS